jgi:hypothetical protein
LFKRFLIKIYFFNEQKLLEGVYEKYTLLLSFGSNAKLKLEGVEA